MAGNSVTTSTGEELNIDSMPHTYTYSAGLLTTDTVKYTHLNGIVDSWVQTYTWTNGSLTALSQWVKQ